MIVKACWNQEICDWGKNDTCTYELFHPRKVLFQLTLKRLNYTVVKFQRIWLPFNARMRQQPGKERCFVAKCISTQSLSEKSTILLIIGLLRIHSNLGSRSITLIGQHQGATFEGFYEWTEKAFLLNVIRRELLVDGDGLGFPRLLNM